MKKFWKISAFALSAAFTFSTVTACGGKGDTEEKSNITADQVLALGDSIVESLADVQSFDFGMSMKSGQSMSGMSMENGISITATANLNQANLDAKLSASIYEKMSGQGMNYDDTQTLSAYLIDGFAYTQDEMDTTGKVFEKSSRPALDYIFEEFSGDMESDLSDILEEIMAAEGEIAIPELPTDLIKTILNDEFTLIQKGDTTRVTLDLKKELNDIFSYVGNLSVNTKVGDVVNYALGYIDEELTWQAFTGAIKDKGSYTVGALVNSIDNELYNASGMRLQEVKDAIFAEPGVYDVLVEEVGTEMADMIVNTSVADLVGEYGALTVDNLVQMAMEDETVTLSSMVGLIEGMFAEMTIGDAFQLNETAEVFNETVAVFKGIRVEDLNANLIFTVKNDKLTRVEVSYNVKVSVSAQGQSMTVYMNSSVYAEDFSDQAQTIALPTGSTVIIYCDECGLTAAESDYCAACRAYVCKDCHWWISHNA